MGLKMFMFAPGLILILASIILQGGNLQTSNSGSGDVNVCSSNGCVQPGTVTAITCNNLITPCKIEPNCPTVVPSPAWCFPWPFNLIAANQGLWLSAGATVILNANVINSALTANNALFAFGSIGTSGWTIIILVTAGLMSLASITILNSGMGAEGVHILAVSGVALGIWLFLSAMDGFITGNPHSLFSYLNSINLAGTTGFGTILYVFASLFWVFGWLGSFTAG